MSARRRWAYIAQLVPLGVPVQIPTLKGSPSAAMTFDGETFALERKNPTRIKVCVDHDRSLPVGELQRVYPERDWWRVAMVLDKEISEELQVGQPISIGLSEYRWGSVCLDEVSIVQQGAVRGAEIIERLDLGPAKEPLVPEAAPTKPKPVQTRKPAPQHAIVYRHPVNARHAEEEAEMRRRLEWLERHTGRYDVEAVILGMQRELNGPSLEEIHAQRVRRVA